MIYEGNGSRLDVLLTNADMSRSRAQKLIRDGYATVDGRVETTPAFCVPQGAQVELTVPPAKEAQALAEDLPLFIAYEDEHLAVVHKERGVVVHPAAGNETGTLVNALLYHLDNLSGIGGEKRPGIVHRLDKETSGLLLVAKDDKTHKALSDALAARQMEKHYYAVVAGVLKENSGLIDAPIARSHKDRKKMAIDPEGRPSQTQWRVVRRWDDKTLVDIHLITGRTHQIRVHMASLGHPVLGDDLYGFRHMPKAKRLMLHAYSLAFTHPATGQRMHFEWLPDTTFGVPKADGDGVGDDEGCPPSNS